PYTTLFRSDRACGLDQLGRHAGCVQSAWLGGSNMHGKVFTDFVGSVEFDQYADTATVHVAGKLVGGFEALEATDRDVFTNLANQGRTSAFDCTVSKRQFGQRSHVSRILVCNQLGNLRDKVDEIVILGNEIGLAVDFNNCALLAVGSNVQPDEAFCGNAAGSLAGLAAQLDTEQLFGTRHVAVGFCQRFLAFHHGRVGFLAQFFDHRGGNLSHSNLLFFETDPGTPARGQTSTTATRAPDSGAHQERPSRPAEADPRRPPRHHPSGRRDGRKPPQVVRPNKRALLAIDRKDHKRVVAFGDLFNRTVKGLIATFEYGVGHTLDVQSDSLARVIVTRNDMLDAFGRMVGINHGHNGNTQRPGFGYGDLVIADVDHEQGVGQ